MSTKNPTESTWWKNLSIENTKKLLNLINLLTDKIEVNGINRLLVMKITAEELNKHGISDLDEAIALTKKLNYPIPLLEVINEDLTTRYIFNAILSSQSDEGILGLKTNLAFRVQTLDIVEELNNIKKDLLDRGMLPFPKNTDFMYLNNALCFRLGDGSMSSVDFSNAPKARKMLECFLEMRKNLPNTTYYKRTDVLKKYKIMFNENLTIPALSHGLANIRMMFRNKPEIAGRFSVTYSKPEDSYNFLLN